MGPLSSIRKCSIEDFSLLKFEWFPRIRRMSSAFISLVSIPLFFKIRHIPLGIPKKRLLIAAFRFTFHITYFSACYQDSCSFSTHPRHCWHGSMTTAVFENPHNSPPVLSGIFGFRILCRFLQLRREFIRCPVAFSRFTVL